MSKQEDIKQFIPCYMKLGNRKNPEWLCSKKVMDFLESVRWLEQKKETSSFLPKPIREKNYDENTKNLLWNQEIIQLDSFSEKLFVNSDANETFFQRNVPKKLKEEYIRRKLNVGIKFV